MEMYKDVKARLDDSIAMLLKNMKDKEEGTITRKEFKKNLTDIKKQIKTMEKAVKDLTVKCEEAAKKLRGEHG